MTQPLGPDPVSAAVMHERLVEAGRRPGDVVVMAAAGSSDPRARRDVYCAATMLADHIGEVHLGFVATGAPRVQDVVRVLRGNGRRRIFVAPYLLARGIFHDRLAECPATAVAAPLGAHPGVIDVMTPASLGWARTRPANPALSGERVAVHHRHRIPAIGSSMASASEPVAHLA